MLSSGVSVELVDKGFCNWDEDEDEDEDEGEEKVDFVTKRRSKRKKVHKRMSLMFIGD